jgi:RNA polymerase sigma-70 factor (ECF subfamily)
MIEAALREIKPVYRDAVVLRDTMDHTYEEIAEILGVSLGTVKSRILRGREALREELINRLNVRPAMQLVPKTAE